MRSDRDSNALFRNAPEMMRRRAVLLCCFAMAGCNALLQPMRKSCRINAQYARPKTADDWKEWRRKEAPSARKTSRSSRVSKLAEGAIRNPLGAAVDVASLFLPAGVDADDVLAQRAQRWAEAIGADASTLDALPVARRLEILDEFERDLKPREAAPPPAEPEPTADINIDWERRVQFDALRDGNAANQNSILQRAIQRDA